MRVCLDAEGGPNADKWLAVMDAVRVGLALRLAGHRLTIPIGVSAPKAGVQHVVVFPREPIAIS